MLNVTSLSNRWSTPIRFLVVLLTALAGLVSSKAIACSIVPGPGQFYTDTASTTNDPAPSLPVVSSAQLHRAQCEPTSGCTDCSCIGSVTLQVQLADAQPWPTNVGLRVSVVQGSLPTGITIPDYPLTIDQGAVTFAGGDNAKQSLDFTLSLVSVDLTGRESLPTEVHLTDRGCNDDGGGCSIAQGLSPPTGFPTIVTVVLGFVLAVRMRLRRK